MREEYYKIDKNGYRTLYDTYDKYSKYKEVSEWYELIYNTYEVETKETEQEVKARKRNEVIDKILS